MDNFLIAKATDVGIARQVNEDSMTVFNSPNGQVLAVCDGMGGQAAGDTASQLAVNIIENILTDNTFATPEEAIQRSVMAANQGVLNRATQDPSLEGMGSTCVMLIVKDGRVHCGWVGDSRIYYISNHTIRQISHDQSYVQQLVDEGQITAAEAATHPQKNEITNCIGLASMRAPETVAVPIMPEPGSVFLLCSDGLTGMVSDAQIERVVSNPKTSLQEKANRLVELANEAGGLDNITVELIQFGAAGSAGAGSGTMVDTPKAAAAIAAKKKKSNNKLIGGIVALLILAGAGYGAYTYLSDSDSGKAKTERKKADKDDDGGKDSKDSKKKGETKEPEGKAQPAEKPAAPANNTKPAQKPAEAKPKPQQNNPADRIREESQNPKPVEEEPQQNDEDIREKYENLN